MRSMVAPAVMAVLLLAAASPRAQAQVPAGPEFRVNTYTALNQDSPAVGMARDGRFVIVWESANQDGSNDAAAGRRYTAAGTAQGADFQVNTYTTNAQGEVAVAVARDGSFLVVWESENQEGTGGDAGIFAQRHNASGTRLGAEFRVNTYTTGDQGLHSAAFAPDKSFIVVSASLVQVPGGNGDTTPPATPLASSSWSTRTPPGTRFPSSRVRRWPSTPAATSSSCGPASRRP
jgi:hypothetical protein